MATVTMKLNRSISDWINRGIEDYARKLRTAHNKAAKLLKEEITGSIIEIKK